MDLTLPVDSIAIAAALCCALVAGLLFAFAVVVIPGFRELGNREFLGAFRAVDRVIQGGQPVFLAVWAGSAVLPVIAVVVRLLSDSGPVPGLLAAAAVVSVVGVHLPTVAVDIRLHSRLQALDVGVLGEPESERVRLGFESRWARWNLARTVAAVVAVLLLVIALAG